MVQLRIPKITFQKPTPKQIIFWGVVLALGIAELFATRGLVRCWTLTSLPGIPPSDCKTTGPNPLGTPAVDTQGTPVATPTVGIAAPESELPPAWDGGSRVNILLIGLDYRDWLAGEYPRSDTMILLTIDPITKTAGMLSIPRDMWVNIPGFGYEKINTAYYLGAAYKLPGGGPALAMKTVEQFLGVPVHYYGQIDFIAFEDLINKLGGVDVYVKEKMVLDPIGSGKDKAVLTPGWRHLNGWKTLAYVRSRKTSGGDVDRAERQQQVIFAIRDKVLDPQNFPSMVAEAPQIYQMVSYGIRTNLSFEDAMKLFILVQQVPRENIKTGIIDYTMVNLDQTPDGLSIFKPISDKIRVLRDEIFTSTGAVGPMASGDPLALAKEDAARIRVLNGSVSAGLGQSTAGFLVSQGLNVTELGNADRAYDRTTIVLYSPKMYTLEYMIALFGVSSGHQIIISPDPAATVDVEIRIGNDWVNNTIIPPG